MRTKEEIEKRRDMFKTLAQETVSKIDDLQVKIDQSESGWKKALFLKEKESLHIVLGIANSQWVELMWVLGE